MDSGALAPVQPVDGPRAQKVYNALVAQTGCALAKNTLACLRAAPYDTFFAAALSVGDIAGFSSVALPYIPRPDGITLTLSPEILARQGNFARVPFIIGDQEDEGTVFSLVQSNLTTAADLENYLETVIYLDATKSQVQQLLATYPDDPAAGSPFRTGTDNVIYPQYKRLAAILGDATFTLIRRNFLQLVNAVAPTVRTYSFLNTYDYGTPVVGTSHASDLAHIFGAIPGPVTETILAYYISFFTTLDPNQSGVQGLRTWPLWAKGNNLLNFTAAGGSELLPDTFRSASFAVLKANQASFRI